MSGLRNRKGRVLAPLAGLRDIALTPVLGSVPDAPNPQRGQVAAGHAAIASIGGTLSAPEFGRMPVEPLLAEPRKRPHAFESRVFLPGWFGWRLSTSVGVKTGGNCVTVGGPQEEGLRC